VVEQQGEPSVAQCRGFAGCFDLAEGLGHPPELTQEVECGMGAALTDGRPRPELRCAGGSLQAGKSHPPHRRVSRTGF
jgi:hypothetical protein